MTVFAANPGVGPTRIAPRRRATRWPVRCWRPIRLESWGRWPSSGAGQRAGGGVNRGVAIGADLKDRPIGQEHGRAEFVAGRRQRLTHIAGVDPFVQRGNIPLRFVRIRSEDIVGKNAAVRQLHPAFFVAAVVIELRCGRRPGVRGRIVEVRLRPENVAAQHGSVRQHLGRVVAERRLRKRCDRRPAIGGDVINLTRVGDVVPCPMVRSIRPPAPAPRHSTRHPR